MSETPETYSHVLDKQSCGTQLSRRIPLTKEMLIFARDKRTGEEFQITDLYWFEENLINWFEQDNPWGRDYEFWLEIPHS